MPISRRRPTPWRKKIVFNGKVSGSPPASHKQDKQDIGDEQASSSMSALAVNATTWISFKKWLLPQQFLPDLIALQEHKLQTDNDIEEASAFMLKQGFASYLAKADLGPKGQPVAGVAVMVARKFGSKPVLLTDAPTGR